LGKNEGKKKREYDRKGRKREDKGKAELERVK
jgi:hypothetical protein